MGAVRHVPLEQSKTGTGVWVLCPLATRTASAAATRAALSWNRPGAVGPIRMVVDAPPIDTVPSPVAVPAGTTKLTCDVGKRGGTLHTGGVGEGCRHARECRSEEHT